MIYMYIQTQNIVITLLNAIMMDSKGSIICNQYNSLNSHHTSWVSFLWSSNYAYLFEIRIYEAKHVKLAESDGHAIL